MFHVGQKVVCVSGRSHKREWCGETDVVVGAIYTIRAIYTEVMQPRLGVGLVFEEIIHPAGPRGREPGFYSSRFRPIVERKTDISVFTKMLTPKQESLDA
jgi:hypothetical protein